MGDLFSQSLSELTPEELHNVPDPLSIPGRQVGRSDAQAAEQQIRMWRIEARLLSVLQVKGARHPVRRDEFDLLREVHVALVQVVTVCDDVREFVQG